MEYDIKEFDEIRPYEAGEMKQAFEDLINDRQFSLVLKGFAPWLPKGVRNGLLRLAFTGIKTPLDFQKRFMKPVVKWIIRKHTDGTTFDDSALRINNGELRIENSDMSQGSNSNSQSNHNSHCAPHSDLQVREFSILNSQLLTIQTYYESMWIARGLNIKYMKFCLPRNGELVEPDVEIELDDYRSYHRDKRSSKDKAK